MKDQGKKEVIRDDFKVTNIEVYIKYLIKKMLSHIKKNQELYKYCG